MDIHLERYNSYHSIQYQVDKNIPHDIVRCRAWEVDPRSHTWQGMQIHKYHTLDHWDKHIHIADKERENIVWVDLGRQSHSDMLLEHMFLSRDILVLQNRYVCRYNKYNREIREHRE